jgi:hypothetical protein
MICPGGHERRRKSNHGAKREIMAKPIHAAKRLVIHPLMITSYIVFRETFFRRWDHIQSKHMQF